MRGTILALLTVLLCIAHGPARADLFNLKLLSDKTLDMTDLESLVKSTTSRWETNDEKAAALAHWFGALGNQSALPYDFAPMEPILQLNNHMNCFCAHWTALYVAIAEGGLGWEGRHYELGDHTVPEVIYDGKRHYLDNSYKFYCTTCDGKTIIGLTDLDDEAGPCDRGPRCKYHNLLYHAPMRLCDDLDGYNRDDKGTDTTLIRSWLSGPWLARDASSRGYFSEVIDEAWADKHWIKFQTGSTYGIYRQMLGLRNSEHYTRYFSSQGTSDEYYYPGSNGKDPDGYANERGNGIWVYTPDLKDPKAGHNASGIIRSGKPAVQPAKPGVESWIEFKVQAANMVTGCFIKAALFRATDKDTVVIEVSPDGNTWTAVWDNTGTGAVDVDVNASAAVRGTVADGSMRPLFNYLVRVRMLSAARTANTGLNGITIKTVTVINKMALPRLDLGRNFITVDYDANRQNETLTFRPLIKKDQYRLGAVEHANLVSADKQDSWAANLWAAGKGAPGFVIYQLETPRPISRIRMGGALWIGGDRDRVTYEYRIFSGTWGDWKDAGSFSTKTRNNSHPRREQTHYIEKTIAAADATKVQFRYTFISPGGGAHGAGAVMLRMEADYAAADAAFEPFEITYNWTEYYEPLPAAPDSGGTTRTHTEIVTSLPHTYWISTGGHIAPRMNWVRMNLRGAGPEPVKPGYSDGKDLGDEYRIPRFKYTWGRLLSLNKPYTVSGTPLSDEFKQNGDQQELTDGRVKEPQINGPWPDRVLATFNGSGPLDLTVDLGATMQVGGGRVDAFARKDKTWFPESVEVFTSTDGTSFKSCTRDKYLAAKYNHNGWPANWPLHPQHDSAKGGVFPNYSMLGNYIFLPFDETVEARFVRFRITPQNGRQFMLSEVHVWDSLAAEPWTPKLAHEYREQATENR